MNTALLLIVLCCQIFIVTMEHVTTANVKSRTKIECKHGYEAVTIITWKKDGVQIAYESKTEANINPKYQLDNGEGISYLIIKDVLAEDAGKYTCIAFVVGQPNRFQEIDITLHVKTSRITPGTNSMAMGKCSLTTTLFGILIYKIFA